LGIFFYMKSTLTFYGAAQTVTGSKHLLEMEDKRFLIDCGLYQGKKELREKNWSDPPFGADTIDRIFITHSHIDHIGYLPRMVHCGYRGPITGTRATLELAEILLRDSAHLQEEEARWANKKGFSRHHPAKPLYTIAAVEKTLPLFEPVQYGDTIHLGNGIQALYRDAGHILGSAWLEITNKSGQDRRKLVFGGDLGRSSDLVLRPPAQPYNVNYLVLESTYGNRLHSQKSISAELEKVINEAADRGGPLLIPSFAVGRTQSLLYLIRELQTADRIPKIPVHLDSPMALKALEVYENHIRDLNLYCRRQHLDGVPLFEPQSLDLVSKVEESKRLVRKSGSRIIIAGSGMVTGGRILHHLSQHLPDPSTTVLFIGYQAEGTRGSSLVNGTKKLKMFGKEIDCRATIERVDGFSGHADYLETLAWLMGFNRPPERIFLVHGEPDAASALHDHISKQYAWKSVIPKEGQSFEIEL